ncbi:MAG TPA: MoaD/ThiS family protein [Candidatus Binataceae bacterium]|nr:MoaD/ThiS family protein [Candidatus Binataceae bacterium]
MATVFIPALMRKLTGGRESILVRGETVAQLISDIENQFPGFRNYVIEDGELKPSIAVSIDGEIASAGLMEAVGDSSEVHFIPALGGG